MPTDKKKTKESKPTMVNTDKKVPDPSLLGTGGARGIADKIAKRKKLLDSI